LDLPGLRNLAALGLQREPRVLPNPGLPSESTPVERSPQAMDSSPLDLRGLVGLASLTPVLAYGRPINALGWALLSLGLTGGWLQLSQRSHAVRAMLAFPALYALFPMPWLFMPGVVHHSIHDHDRGRLGFEIWPGARFGRDGPNTRLLESYLGPAQATWCGTQLSPYMNDGNCRAFYGNLIFEPELAKALDLLPDDAARCQVLECFVAKGNLLHGHQNALLGALEHRGLPADHDSESWWRASQAAFQVERDYWQARKLGYDFLSVIRSAETQHGSESLTRVELLLDAARVLSSGGDPEKSAPTTTTSRDLASLPRWTN